MANKKHEDGQKELPNFQDMTLEGYITKYYIEPSKDHGMKYPRVILERMGFMGHLAPMEFWIWLLEPPKLNEVRVMTGNRLVWPYADRLANNAAKFVKLEEKDQDYVMKARRQNPPIWWRSDEMENFRAIAKESYRYNQLSDEEKAQYQKSVMAQARRLAARA
jgi:hypothetical protein